MRKLGLDYGDKYIGISISDESCTIATPLDVLEKIATSDDIKRIQELVNGYNVDTLVLGDPKRLDGSRGEASQKVSFFKKELENYIGVPIVLWDERFTTKEAEIYLRDINVSRKRKKNIIQMMSAQRILQGFLDAHKRSEKDERGADGESQIENS
jgi:putative Holliday junction resolvase